MFLEFQSLELFFTEFNLIQDYWSEEIYKTFLMQFLVLISFFSNQLYNNFIQTMEARKKTELP